MHWLSVMRLARLVRGNVDRQLTPDERGRESGAVASIVAILFGTGVLLGLGALVIDTGSLLYERRQLQNGADAAALAIAKACSKAPKITPCNAAAVTADWARLAGANAADQTANVDSVCGSVALVTANPGTFPPCPPASTALVQCPPTASAAKYVEVRTSTLTGTSPILPPVLAQMLAGGSYSGENVKACARAGWGPRSVVGPTLPFAISSCEWYKATANGVGFAPSPLRSIYPQYSPFPDLLEQAMVLNAPLLPSTDECYTWQGHDFPGGFGWLDRTDATPAPGCQAIIDAAGWVGADSGAGAGSAGHCATTIEGYVGHVVQVPVFDCMSQYKINFPICDNTANGTHSYYHVLSKAAFFVTAFDTASVQASIDDGHVVAPANRHPSAASSAACAAKGGPGSKCVYGWFLTETGSGGVIDPDALDTGDNIIQELG